MTAHDSPPDDLCEPPASTTRVLTIGSLGVGFVALALVTGLVTGAPLKGVEPHSADTIRALLSVIGLVVAGSAVSLRPKWFVGWLLYSAAGFLGYGAGTAPPEGTEWFLVPPRNWVAGVPNSWDSVQTFFLVAGGCAGLIGAAFCLAPAFVNFLRATAGSAPLKASRVPLKLVQVALLAWVAFHFAGILSAITSPAPSSWLTDQYWKRVSWRYLYFTYLNNAYQFYSPEPGPATYIWICIEYQTPETSEVDDQGFPKPPPKDCQWVYVPERPKDVRDPLGLTFYRRLSLTENVTHIQPVGYQFLQTEWEQVQRRRLAATTIPKERLPDNMQYHNPVQLVSLQILPSYAKYFAQSYADPAKEVKGIKIYRVAHALIELNQIKGSVAPDGSRVAPIGPYNSVLFQPIYLGEFDKHGRLKNPTDPLLYWRIPIFVKRPHPDSQEEYERRGGYAAHYSDFVSEHAGCPRPPLWSER